jgi:hypothetical protein
MAYQSITDKIVTFTKTLHLNEIYVIVFPDDFPISESIMTHWILQNKPPIQTLIPEMSDEHADAFDFGITPNDVDELNELV